VEYGAPLADVMSYVIPDRSEDIYGCGYGWIRPAYIEEDHAADFRSEATIAGFFGMRPGGDLKFVFNLGESDGKY
jgi:hypothetical protein